MLTGSRLVRAGTLLLSAAVTVLAGCEDSSLGDACQTGTVECKCWPAGGCNPGLQCSNNKCVPVTRDSGVVVDGAPAGADAGAPDAGAGGDGAPVFPIHLSFLDRKTEPCTDFYQFACGGWIEQSPLRTGETWRRWRSAPDTAIDSLVIKLIEDAWNGRNTSDVPETKAIGNYHQTCLSAPNETTSRTTMKALLSMVDGIASMDDFARVSAEFRKRGAHTLMFIYASLDPGDPQHFILTLDQGTRVMSSRDYYIDTRYSQLREQYKMHVAKMATLVGVTIDPEAVLRVETALSMPEQTLVERRDPLATYNKQAMTAAQALAPHFPWRVHLEALGLPAAEQVNLRSPPFLKGLESYLATAPLEDLKHYLRWMMLENKAWYLDQPVIDEEFNFHDRIFSGRMLVPQRRSVCLGATEASFGMQISRRYVEQYFDKRTRAEVKAMVAGIKAAFSQRLQALTWLDEPTRTAALAKLAAIDDKVGHPDEWPLITSVPPMRPWLDEAMERGLTSWKGVVSALGETSNRKNWNTTPITINAFYRPTYNEIVFPAAILQPPWFDPNRDRVGNYAAIGAVIGHELTHGFDDSGRHYDGTGALRNWWTPTVDTEARRRSQCLIDYYGKLVPAPGLMIDGALTVGENTADLGGVRLALTVYLASGTPAPAFGGFDARQQFFIGHAQTWCSRIDPGLLAGLLRSDVHSPDKQRVNGVLSHMPEFMQAFSCPANAAMQAQPVCEIW